MNGILNQLLSILPTVEINDQQVNFVRVLGILAGVFASGGLLGWLGHRLNFLFGSDCSSIEMFGVAHEELDPKTSGGKKYMLTEDAWGRVEDVRTTTIGPSNPKLANLLVAAIRRAPSASKTDEPYVRISSGRARRWTRRKLDAIIDGNDWSANPARVKRRPTNKDRFACCMFGPRDNDGIKSGIGIIFDDAMADIYAEPGFPELCKVADEWAIPDLPRLVHLAAIAWLKRKQPDSDIIAWTATLTSRS